MARFYPVKFQNRIMKCGSLAKDALLAVPNQTLFSYVLGNMPHCSLLVTPNRILPHLYFLRTTISNYQGATADAMEIFRSHGIDVRAYDETSMGDIAIWNVCLTFPEGSNFFQMRDRITTQLQQKCGIVPPVDFFFVEFFRHLGDVHRKAREVLADVNCDLNLGKETISEMGISWDIKEPTAAVATPFELIPGILFSLIMPTMKLLECELLIEDRVGSIAELTKLVSHEIDLVASSGMTLAFGKNALWRFYGVVTGDIERLKQRLADHKPPLNIKRIEEVHPAKL
jgi:hypothetical protein